MVVREEVEELLVTGAEASLAVDDPTDIIDFTSDVQFAQPETGDMSDEEGGSHSTDSSSDTQRDEQPMLGTAGAPPGRRRLARVEAVPDEGSAQRERRGAVIPEAYRFSSVGRKDITWDGGSNPFMFGITRPCTEKCISFRLEDLVRYSAAELFTRAWPLVPTRAKTAAFAPYGQLPEIPDILNVRYPNTEEIAHFMRSTALEFAGRNGVITPYFLRCLLVKASVNSLSAKSEIINHSSNRYPEEPAKPRWETDESNSCSDDDHEDWGSSSGAVALVGSGDNITSFDWAVAVMYENLQPRVPSSVIRMLNKVASRCDINTLDATLCSWGMHRIISILLFQIEQETPSIGLDDCPNEWFLEAVELLFKLILASKNIDFLLSIFRWVHKHREVAETVVLKTLGPWVTFIEACHYPRVPVPFPASWMKCQDLSLTHSLGLEASRCVVGVCVVTHDGESQGVIFTSRGVYKISLVPPYNLICKNDSACLTSCCGVYLEGKEIAVQSKEMGVVTFYDATTLEIRRSIQFSDCVESNNIRVYNGMGDFVVPHFYPNKTAQCHAMFSDTVATNGYIESPPLALPPETSSLSVQFFLCPLPTQNCTEMDLIYVKSFGKVWLRVVLTANNKTSCLSIAFMHDDKFVAEIHEPLSSRWSLWSAILEEGDDVFTWNIYKDAVLVKTCVMRYKVLNLSFSSAASIDLLKGTFSGFIAKIRVWHDAQFIGDMLASSRSWDSAPSQASLLIALKMNEGTGRCLRSADGTLTWKGNITWTPSSRNLTGETTPVQEVIPYVPSGNYYTLSNTFEIALVEKGFCTWMSMSGRILDQKLLDVHPEQLYFLCGFTSRMYSVCFETGSDVCLRWVDTHTAPSIHVREFASMSSREIRDGETLRRVNIKGNITPLKLTNLVLSQLNTLLITEGENKSVACDPSHFLSWNRLSRRTVARLIDVSEDLISRVKCSQAEEDDSRLLLLCVCGRLLAQQLKWMKRECPEHLIPIIASMYEKLCKVECQPASYLAEAKFVMKELHRVLLVECVAYDYLLQRIMDVENLIDIRDVLVSDYIPSLVTSVLEKNLKKPFMVFLNRLKEGCIVEAESILTGGGVSFRPSYVLLPALLSMLSRSKDTQWHLVAVALLDSLCKGIVRLFRRLFPGPAEDRSTLHESLELLKQTALGVVMFPVAHFLADFNLDKSIVFSVLTLLGESRALLAPFADAAVPQFATHTLMETHRIFAPTIQAHTTALNLRYASSIEVLHEHPLPKDLFKVKAILVTNESQRVLRTMENQNLTFDCGGLLEIDIVNTKRVENSFITVNATVEIKTEVFHWIHEICSALGRSILYNTKCLLFIRNPHALTFPHDSIFRGGLSVKTLREHNILGDEELVSIDEADQKELIALCQGEVDLRQWQEIYDRKKLLHHDSLEPVMRALCAAHAWHLRRAKGVSLMQHVQHSFKFMHKKSHVILEALQKGGKEAIMERAVFLLHVINPRDRMEAPAPGQEQCEELVARNSSAFSSHSTPEVHSGASTELRFSTDRPGSGSLSHINKPIRNSSDHLRASCDEMGSILRPRNPLLSHGVEDEAGVVNNSDNISVLVFNFLIDGCNGISNEDLIKALVDKVQQAATHKAAFALQEKLLTTHPKDGILMSYVVCLHLFYREFLRSNCPRPVGEVSSKETPRADSYDAAPLCSASEEGYIQFMYGCGFQRELELQKAICSLFNIVVEQGFSRITRGSLRHGWGAVKDALPLCALLCHSIDGVDISIISPSTVFSVLKELILVPPNTDSFSGSSGNDSWLHQGNQCGLFDLLYRGAFLPNSLQPVWNGATVVEDDTIGVHADDDFTCLLAQNPWRTKKLASITPAASLIQQDFYTNLASGSVLVETPEVLYFEATLEVCLSNESIVFVGVTSSSIESSESVGGEPSVAFCSDGTVRHSGRRVQFTGTWSVGDVIGCGILVPSAAVFFTRNGKFLGIATECHFTTVLPFVAVNTSEAVVKLIVNFGENTSFKFDFPSLHRSGYMIEASPVMISDAAFISCHYLVTQCYKNLKFLHRNVGSVNPGPVCVLLEQAATYLKEVVLQLVTRLQCAEVDNRNKEPHLASQRHRIESVLLARLFRTVNAIIKCFCFNFATRHTHSEILWLCINTLHKATDHWVKTCAARALSNLARTLPSEYFTRAFEAVHGSPVRDVIVYSLADLALTKIRDKEIHPGYTPQFVGGQQQVSGPGVFHGKEPLPAHGTHVVGFRIRRRTQLRNGVGATLGGCYYVGLTHGQPAAKRMASFLKQPDVYVLQDADDEDQVAHLLLHSRGIAHNSHRRIYGNDEIIWVELNADLGEIRYYREDMIPIGLAFANIERKDDLYPFVSLFNEDAICDIIAFPPHEKELCKLLPEGLHRSIAVNTLQQLHVVPCLGRAVSQWIYSFFVCAGGSVDKTIIALAIMGGERSVLYCHHKTHGSVVVEAISEPMSKASVYREADPDMRLFSVDIADLKPAFVIPPLFCLSEEASLTCCKWLTEGVKKILFEAFSVAPFVYVEDRQRAEIEKEFKEAISEAVNTELLALKLHSNDALDTVPTHSIEREQTSFAIVQSTSSSFLVDGCKRRRRSTPVTIDRRFSSKTLFTPNPSIGITSSAKYSVLRGSVVIEDVFSFAVSITIKERKGAIIYIGVTTETDQPADPHAVAQCKDIWALCNRDSASTNNTNCFVEPGMIYSAGQLLFDTGDVVIVKINRNEGTASFSRIREGKTVDFGVLFEKIPVEEKLRPFVLIGPESVVVFSFLDGCTFPARDTYSTNGITSWMHSVQPVSCSSCGRPLSDAWYEGEGGVCLCYYCFSSWHYPRRMFHFTMHNYNMTDYHLSHNCPEKLLLDGVVGFVESEVLGWSSGMSVNVQINRSACMAVRNVAFAVSDALLPHGKSRIDLSVSHVAGIDGLPFGSLRAFDLLWCVENTIGRAAPMKRDMLLVSSSVVPPGSKVVVELSFLDEESNSSVFDSSSLFLGVTTGETDCRIMNPMEFKRFIAQGSAWGTWCDSQTKLLPTRRIFLHVDTTNGTVKTSSSLLGLSTHPTVLTSQCPAEDDTNLRVVVFTRTPCQLSSLCGWISVDDEVLDVESSSVAIGVVPEGTIGPDANLMTACCLLPDTVRDGSSKERSAWKLTKRVEEEGSGILFSIGDIITILKMHQQLTVYRNGLHVATYALNSEELFGTQRLVMFFSTRGMVANIVPPVFGKTHLGKVIEVYGEEVGLVMCLCPCQGRYIVRKKDVRHCALSADAVTVGAGTKVTFKSGSLAEPKRGVVVAVNGNTVRVRDEEDKSICFSLDKSNIFVQDNEGMQKVLQAPYTLINLPDGSVTRVFEVGSSKFKLHRNESYNGIMFDIQAHDSVTLTGLSALTHTTGRHRVEVFFKMGTHQASRCQCTAWKKVFSNYVELRAGRQFFVKFNGILIDSNSTFALYINVTDNFGVGHYTRESGCIGGISSEMDSDGTLTVLVGRTSESSTPFSELSSTPCGFCGSLMYTISKGVHPAVMEGTDADSCQHSEEERYQNSCQRDWMEVKSYPTLISPADRVDFLFTVFDTPIVVIQLLLPALIGSSIRNATSTAGLHVSLFYTVLENAEAKRNATRKHQWTWAHHQILSTRQGVEGIKMEGLNLKLQRGTYIFSIVCYEEVKDMEGMREERVPCLLKCDDKTHTLQNRFYSIQGLVGNMVTVFPDTLNLPRTISTLSTGDFHRKTKTVSCHGIMFNIRSKRDVLLEEIFCVSEKRKINFNVKVFWKEGNMRGAEEIPSQWNEVAIRNLHTVDIQACTLRPLDLKLKANQIYAIYINTTMDCGLRLFDSSDSHRGKVGDVYRDDGVLTICLGKKSISNELFSEGITGLVAFCGRIKYRLLEPNHSVKRGISALPAMKGLVVTRILAALIAFTSGPFATSESFKDVAFVKSLKRIVKHMVCGVGNPEVVENLLSSMTGGNSYNVLEGSVMRVPLDSDSEITYFDSLCEGDLAIAGRDIERLATGELVRVTKNDANKAHVVKGTNVAHAAATCSVPVDSLLPIIECRRCRQPFAITRKCQSTGGAHLPLIREEDHIMEILARYISQQYDVPVSVGTGCAASFLRSAASHNTAAEQLLKPENSASIHVEEVDSCTVKYLLPFVTFHQSKWDQPCSGFVCPFVYSKAVGAHVTLVFTPLGNSWSAAFLTDLPLRMERSTSMKVFNISLHIELGNDVMYDLLHTSVAYYAAHGGPLHVQLKTFTTTEQCLFPKTDGSVHLRLTLSPGNRPLPTPAVSAVSRPWRWEGGHEAVELKPVETSELDGVFSNKAWPAEKPRFWRLGVGSDTNASVFFLEALIQFPKSYFKISWERSRNQVIRRSFSIARDEEVTIAFTVDEEFVVYDGEDRIRCYVSYKDYEGSTRNSAPKIALMNAGPHSVRLHLRSPPEIVSEGFSITSRTRPEGSAEYTPAWTVFDQEKVKISDNGLTASCKEASGQAVIGSQMPIVGLSGFVVQITRSDRATGDSLGSGHFAGVAVSLFDQLEPHFVKLRQQLNQLWIVQDIYDADSLPTQERIPPLDSASNSVFLAGTKLHFLLDRDNGTLSLARNNESPRVVFYNIPPNVGISPFVRLDHANASATLAPFACGSLGSSRMGVKLSALLTSHPITPTLLRRIPFRVVLSMFVVFRHIVSSLSSYRRAIIEEHWSDQYSHTKISYRLFAAVGQLVELGAFSREMASTNRSSLEEFCRKDTVLTAINMLLAPLDSPYVMISNHENVNEIFMLLPGEYEVIGRVGESSMFRLLRFDGASAKRCTLHIFRCDDPRVTMDSFSEVSLHRCVVQQVSYVRPMAPRTCFGVITHEWFDGTLDSMDHVGFTKQHQLTIMRSLLTAIEHWHLHSLVHGNIHPANVYIRYERTGDVYCALWNVHVLEREDYCASPQLRRHGLHDKEGDMWSAAQLLRQCCKLLEKEERFQSAINAMECGNFPISNTLNQLRWFPEGSKSEDNDGLLCRRTEQLKNLPSGSCSGIMFDIVAQRGKVDLVKISFFPGITSITSVALFVRTGTFRGAEEKESKWHCVLEKEMEFVEDSELVLEGFGPITLLLGEPVGIYIHTTNTRGIKFYSIPEDEENAVISEKNEADRNIGIGFGRASKDVLPFASFQSDECLFHGSVMYMLPTPTCCYRTPVAPQVQNETAVCTKAVGSPVIISSVGPGLVLYNNGQRLLVFIMGEKSIWVHRDDITTAVFDNAPIWKELEEGLRRVIFRRRLPFSKHISHSFICSRKFTFHRKACEQYETHFGLKTRNCVDWWVSEPIRASCVVSIREVNQVMGANLFLSIMEPFGAANFCDIGFHCQQRHAFLHVDEWSGSIMSIEDTHCKLIKEMTFDLADAELCLVYGPVPERDQSPPLIAFFNARYNGELGAAQISSTDTVVDPYNEQDGKARDCSLRGRLSLSYCTSTMESPHAFPIAPPVIHCSNTYDEPKSPSDAQSVGNYDKRTCGTPSSSQVIQRYMLVNFQPRINCTVEKVIFAPLPPSLVVSDNCVRSVSSSKPLKCIVAKPVLEGTKLHDIELRICTSDPATISIAFQHPKTDWVVDLPLPIIKYHGETCVSSVTSARVMRLHIRVIPSAKQALLSTDEGVVYEVLRGIECPPQFHLSFSLQGPLDSVKVVHWKVQIRENSRVTRDKVSDIWDRLAIKHISPNAAHTAGKIRHSFNNASETNHSNASESALICHVESAMVQYARKLLGRVILNYGASPTAKALLDLLPYTPLRDDLVALRGLIRAEVRRSCFHLLSAACACLAAPLAVQVLETVETSVNVIFVSLQIDSVVQLASTPYGATLMLILLRTANTYTQSIRNVALRCALRLLKTPNSLLPSHEVLCATAAPLLRVISKMCRKGKVARTFVQLGILLVSELAERYRAERPTLNPPGKRTCIPYAAVICANIAINAITSAPPLPLPEVMAQWQKEGHHIRYEIRSGPMQPDGSTPFYGVFSQPCRGRFGAKTFEVCLSSRRHGNVIVGWDAMPEALCAKTTELQRVSGRTPLPSCGYLIKPNGKVHLCLNGSEEKQALPVRVKEEDVIIVTCLYSEQAVTINLRRKSRNKTKTRIDIPVNNVLTLPVFFAETWEDATFNGEQLAGATAGDVSRLYARLQHQYNHRDEEVAPQSFEFYAELSLFRQHLVTSEDQTASTGPDKARPVPSHDLVSFTHIASFLGIDPQGNEVPTERLLPYLQRLHIFDALASVFSAIVDIKRPTELFDLWKKLRSLCSSESLAKIQEKTMRPFRGRKGRKGRVTIHTMHAQSSVHYGLYATLARSVFGQLYTQLQRSHISTFYASPMFKVRLPGFASIDAGGPYRDILSQLASEIMTVHPSGEFQQNPVFKDYGSDGQLAVMPNVAWSTDSQSASVFAFFGKLLAACFVSKDLLTVEFPPLFWKLLLGEETTVRDLRVVDRDITRQLAPEELMKRSPEELEERFPGICESWRQLCDESSRLESCAELPPTSPYVAGALAAHITSHEIRRYSLAMACIQQGFGEVIPLYTLHAFRWQQVEHIICGTPELSYEGLCGVCEVSLPPEHAEMFNEVVQSMSDKDRRLLLRFTTGQTRLPLKKNIKVEQSDAALDTLPKSSTCFFTLYLPVYSSVTIMRKRMLYAIRHCEAIDGDGEAEEPIILNM